MGIFEAGHPLDFARHPRAVLAAGKITEAVSYAAILARYRVPYRTRHAVVAAHGADALEAVSVNVLDLVVLAPTVQNLLRAVIENGRLAAMPEIATQYHALVNTMTGVSDATVYSAFPINGTQLPEVVTALEKRFKRKLNANVVVEPGLIGGIRVVVGDEVLDTSVKARLEQMKVALTA